MATKTKTAPAVETEPTQTPTEAYLAADRAGRIQMRTDWQTALNDAVKNGDLNAAQSIITERDAATEAARAGKRSEPVDVSLVVAQRIAELTAAVAMLTDGTVTPAGIDPAEVDLSAVSAHVLSIAEANSVDTERAQSVAEARVSRAGKRGDVGAFIHARLVALTTEDQNTFRVSEIRSEAIDGYRPTGGAVSAALNADREIEGVVTVDAANAPSGALSARLA